MKMKKGGHPDRCGDCITQFVHNQTIHSTTQVSLKSLNKAA